MFNRVRFCFLDRFGSHGEDYLGPKNPERYTPLDQLSFSGTSLEAKYCTKDRVWKVLDCKPSLALENTTD
jgi:hypothetical protein